MEEWRSLEALLPVYRRVEMVNATTFIQLFDFYADVVIVVVLVFDAVGSLTVASGVMFVSYLCWAIMFALAVAHSTIRGLRELQGLQLKLPFHVKVFAFVQGHVVYATWKELQRLGDSDSWHFARARLLLSQASFGTPASALLVGLLLTFGSPSHKAVWPLLTNLALTVVSGGLCTWVGARANEAHLARHFICYITASASYTYLLTGFVQSIGTIAMSSFRLTQIGSWGPWGAFIYFGSVFNFLTGGLHHLPTVLIAPCIAFEPAEVGLSYCERCQRRRHSTESLLKKIKSPGIGDTALLLEVCIAEVGHSYKQAAFRFLAIHSTIALGVLPFLLWIIADLFNSLDGAGVNQYLPWWSLVAAAAVRALALVYIDCNTSWDSLEPCVAASTVGAPEDSELQSLEPEI